jgi:hypothetical protein
MPPPGPPGPYGGAAPSHVAMAPPQQDANGKRFAAPPHGLGAIYLFNPSPAGPVLNVLVSSHE